jgi:membrane associated rhomboid family serine protease
VPGAAARPRAWWRRIDARSWPGALFYMGVAALILYIVELIDWLGDHHLDKAGLRPRSVSHLVGVVTSPFLHETWWQLVSITGPFVLIGWVVLLAGVRQWLIATATIIVIGGLATWLVAPDQLIIGVSPVVFGWTGYLVARAFITRKILWILAAIAVAFFFSGLFGGLLPSINATVPWEAHLCGFLAGIVAGILIHPTRKRIASAEARRARRATQIGPADPPPVS